MIGQTIIQVATWIVSLPETVSRPHLRVNRTNTDFECLSPGAIPLTQSRTQQSTGSTDSKLSTQRTSSSAQRKRSVLGLHPQAPIDEGHEEAPQSGLVWSRIRTVMREPFAEFWGTAVMVMFGNGSVAQVLLSAGQSAAPGGNGFGQYQSINWGQVETPCHESWCTLLT